MQSILVPCNKQGHVDKHIQVMSAHPDYLDPFLRTHNYILRGDGPLSYNVRNYIAILAAARHQCSYLVNRQMQEFIQGGGDKRWLQGLDFAPKKLRDLNEINKILAHQPWRITARHIERLTRGRDENWSISEVVHAIVVLTHFHAMCSLVFSSGINDDDPGPVLAAAAATVCPDDELHDPDMIDENTDVTLQHHHHPAVGSMPVLVRKAAAAAAVPAANATGDMGLVKTIVCAPGPGRTGQDSPPLNSHLLPGSPPSEASVEVLMQKMKSISQQHKQMGDEDRSPEELQKVFEKVEIALPHATHPNITSPTTTTPPKETSSTILKEKDQNAQQMNPVQTSVTGNLNGAVIVGSAAAAASAAVPTTTSSLPSLTTAAAAAAGSAATGSGCITTMSQSASPTGVRDTGSRSGAGAGQQQESESASAAAAASPPAAPSSTPSSFLSRFVIDPDFSYIDFARRGANSEFTTFRVQDYSWDDHGFSLVNQLYNDVGNLLDEKFKKTYHMTYYTMGQKTNVDTSMFRRAIWNYIQCIFGIRHDDYDYREVNELLTRDLKTYIKTVCCFPSRVRKEDCDRVMPEFWRSEKIHVNLMITEARLQASLLYALRAVMKFMT